MSDTPSPDTGAEARIVITTPEDVTSRALEANAVVDDEPALIEDAPSEEPEESTESSTEETGDEEPDDKKGKPPKGVQKRLDELTKEKYDAQRRADAAQAQLERAMAMLERQQQGQPEAAPAIDPSAAPDPRNYTEGELDLNYIRDMARHEVRQELRAAKEEADRARTVTEIQSREEAARAKYTDYDEVVSGDTLGVLRGNWDVFQTLATHESGPELAYYLGKNPAETLAIAKMSPVNAALRLGQLLSTLTPDAAPKASTPSKAPPPISPIRGSGASPAVNYEAKMAEAEASGNFDLWRKLKTARDSGK